MRGGLGGAGTGMGVGGGGRTRSAAPAEPAATPMPLLAPPPPPPRGDAARAAPPMPASASGASTRPPTRRTTASNRPAKVTFVVTAGDSSGVGATAPLVEAVRAALAGGRGGCALAGARGGKNIKLRLTVDARGAIVRVEVVAGDKAAEGCLQKALAGLSSATVARGGAGAAGGVSATGTVEITLSSRS